MKKENIGFAVVFLILMTASFYAGYNISPTTKINQQQQARIKDLEEVIVQQQVLFQYMLKSMPTFKMKNVISIKK